MEKMNTSYIKALSFQIEDFFVNPKIYKYVLLKNIIALRNLVNFYEKCPDAKASLEKWISIAKAAV